MCDIGIPQVDRRAPYYMVVVCPILQDEDVPHSPAIACTLLPPRTLPTTRDLPNVVVDLLHPPQLLGRLDVIGERNRHKHHGPCPQELVRQFHRLHQPIMRDLMELHPPVHDPDHAHVEAPDGHVVRLTHWLVGVSQERVYLLVAPPPACAVRRGPALPGSGKEGGHAPKGRGTAPAGWGNDGPAVVTTPRLPDHRPSAGTVRPSYVHFSFSSSLSFHDHLVEGLGQLHHYRISNKKKLEVRGYRDREVEHPPVPSNAPSAPAVIVIIHADQRRWQPPRPKLAGGFFPLPLRNLTQGTMDVEVKFIFQRDGFGIVQLEGYPNMRRRRGGGGCAVAISSYYADFVASARQRANVIVVRSTKKAPTVRMTRQAPSIRGWGGDRDVERRVQQSCELPWRRQDENAIG
mmetsp:Transcript_26511/g.56403  ORF Transcript_26511/g.56403 Transcript_26511/m.56403 type:complete len:404 (-) Transcript_26511:81-1292(-)